MATASVLGAGSSWQKRHRADHRKGNKLSHETYSTPFMLQRKNYKPFVCKHLRAWQENEYNYRP